MKHVVDVSIMLSTLVIVGMVTSKVGKRFAFKGLKALSEILIRYISLTLSTELLVCVFRIISVLHFIFPH